MQVEKSASILDVLDKLLEKGVVAKGDLILSVADIELVTVSLAAVIASTATLNRVSGPRMWVNQANEPVYTPLASAVSTNQLTVNPVRYKLSNGVKDQSKRVATPTEHYTPAPVQEEENEAQLADKEQISFDQDSPEKGLVKLVLTIVELLRQLMERQAISRMADGTLTQSACERLGNAFLNLERKMAELRGFFGFNEKDLNLELGPLGHLI